MHQNQAPRIRVKSRKRKTTMWNPMKKIVLFFTQEVWQLLVSQTRTEERASRKLCMVSSHRK